MKYIFVVNWNCGEILKVIMSPGDSKWTRIEVNFANFLLNPSLRRKFSDYHPNDRDQVQRISTMWPCQLVDHTFLQREYEKK